MHVTAGATTSRGKHGLLCAVAWLGVVSGVIACYRSDTVVVVHVVGDLGGVEQLRATLTINARSRTLMIPEQARSISLPTSFSVLIDRSIQGRLDVSVDALNDSHIAIARGTASLDSISVGQVNQLVVDLSPADGGLGPDGGVADGGVGDGSADDGAVEGSVDTNGSGGSGAPGQGGTGAAAGTSGNGGAGTGGAATGGVGPGSGGAPGTGGLATGGAGTGGPGTGGGGTGGSSTGGSGTGGSGAGGSGTGGPGTGGSEATTGGAGGGGGEGATSGSEGGAGGAGGEDGAAGMADAGAGDFDWRHRLRPLASGLA